MASVRSIIIFLVTAAFISGCVQTSELIIDDKKTQQVVVKKEEPVKVNEPEKVVSRPKKRLGISLDEVSYLLDGFMDIKLSGNAAGVPRFTGRTENGLTILELAGRKDDLSQISITFFYPANISEDNRDLNRAIMVRFFKNCVPAYGDWFERSGDILKEFDELGTGVKIEKSLYIGGRSIKMTYDKGLNIINIEI